MNNSLTISVRVQPRGSRSEISGIKDGYLRVKTTAAPTDGKANEDVIKQLARAFDVPKSRVSLRSGAAARNKIFVIERPQSRPAWLNELESEDIARPG